MINQIEQLWLKSFHSVYEYNSFKKAAEQLDLPTSNVSRHVALLEEKLNTRLLERTTRRMTPTEAGEQLYSTTRGLLVALNDALEDVSQNAQTIMGQLRILIPDIPLLAEAVVSFCIEHPAISLCCETSLSPREDLLDGFDLILSYHRGSLCDSGWVAKEITRWKSVVVVSPKLLNLHKRPYELADLNQVPCISSLTALDGAPWVFKNADGKLIKQHVNSTFKVNSGHIAKTGAVAGIGLAILPADFCSSELKAGSLEVIKLEVEPEDLVLYAFYAGRKHLAKKISIFVDHLQNRLVKNA